MTIAASPTGAPAATRGWRRKLAAVDVATLSIAAVLLIAALEKFTFRAGAPLWMDEVWTGMIASQRSLAGFMHQCDLDVNAPLSYLVAWLWAGVSGLSNAALRFPSMLFASIAPLVVLAASRQFNRNLRFIWCGLLACWLPGLLLASEARSYSLVLLLATAGTIAFIRLLRTPTLSAASLWTCLSALLILSHYVAAVMVAVQGIAYLAIHRMRAIRTWPAALAFIPAAASLGSHAALLSHFSSATGAYVAPSRRLTDLSSVTDFFGGGGIGCLVLLAWTAVGLIMPKISRNPQQGVRDPPDPRDLWLIAGLSVGAVALCILISIWRPILTARYLTPMAPGVILGLALIAHRLSRSWPLAPAALIAIQLGMTVGLVLRPADGIYAMNFQTASKWMMHVGVKRLVFVWDDPSAERADPGAFGQIGGFFFMREGRAIPVDAVLPSPGEDLNQTLIARAAAPGAAILWLYDRGVMGTEALTHPPDLQRLDPRWTCQDFGRDLQHVLACVRKDGERGDRPLARAGTGLGSKRNRDKDPDPAA